MKVQLLLFAAVSHLVIALVLLLGSAFFAQINVPFFSLFVANWER